MRSEHTLHAIASLATFMYGNFTPHAFGPGTREHFHLRVTERFPHGFHLIQALRWLTRLIDTTLVLTGDNQNTQGEGVKSIFVMTDWFWRFNEFPIPQDRGVRHVLDAGQFAAEMTD